MPTTITISGLPAAGALTGTELVPIVQSGNTVQSTVQAMSLTVLPVNLTLAGLTSAYPPSTHAGWSAYTTDQGQVYSNGTYWVPTQNYFYTPQQFGAYGDNSHDDTAALQAWINYIGAANPKPTGFLPPGGYKITTALTFPTAFHGVITGAGSAMGTTNASFLQPTGCRAFTMAGDSNSALITISQIGITGSAALDATALILVGGAGLEGTQGHNIVLDRLLIQNVPTSIPSAVQIEGIDLIELHNLLIYGNAGAGCVGLNVINSNVKTYNLDVELFTGTGAAAVAVSGVSQVDHITPYFEANTRAINWSAAYDGSYIGFIDNGLGAVTAATATVNAHVYVITVPGNTTWTAIGAANNLQGTQFTANGAGAGTGVCKAYTGTVGNVLTVMTPIYYGNLGAAVTIIQGTAPQILSIGATGTGWAQYNLTGAAQAVVSAGALFNASSRMNIFGGQFGGSISAPDQVYIGADNVAIYGPEWYPSTTNQVTIGPAGLRNIIIDNLYQISSSAPVFFAAGSDLSGVTYRGARTSVNQCLRNSWEFNNKTPATGVSANIFNITNGSGAFRLRVMIVSYQGCVALYEFNFTIAGFSYADGANKVHAATLTTPGLLYMIVAPGNTTFTSNGAVNSTAGTIYIANTVTPTGTGTVAQLMGNILYYTSQSVTLAGVPLASSASTGNTGYAITNCSCTLTGTGTVGVVGSSMMVAITPTFAGASSTCMGSLEMLGWDPYNDNLSVVPQ
jgi:hypothetical protein